MYYNKSELPLQLILTLSHPVTPYALRRAPSSPNDHDDRDAFLRVRDRMHDVLTDSGSACAHIAERALAGDDAAEEWERLGKEIDAEAEKANVIGIWELKK